MKKIYSLMLAIVASMTVVAQSEYLPISVVVGDMVEPFPANAKIQVENKLHQLLTKQGISAMGSTQFALTAIAVPQNKEVLAGPPTQYVETMDVTFYIVDLNNQIVFASESQTLKGVGTTDTKSYMDALKKINLQNQKMAAFVASGKEKIIAYYNAQAPTILADAKTKAHMKQYEEALWLASSIPAQCTYYGEAQQVLVECYQMYIDNECQVALAEAKAIWAAEQNAEGAAKAGEQLKRILPDAACYGDAQVLYKEIKAKVLDDWKFEMKIYQDQIDLEKQRIEAARAIGVAYGSHQQPTTYNLGFLY